MRVSVSVFAAVLSLACSSEKPTKDDSNKVTPASAENTTKISVPCKEAFLPEASKCDFAEDEMGTRVKCGNYTGPEIRCYGNGQVKSEGLFKDGFPNGESRSFYPNGAKKSLHVYDNGRTVGDVLEWFENGNLKSKRTEQGDITISRIEYYLDGQIERRETCTSKWDCKTITFYPNGNTKRVSGRSKNGLDGPLVEYDETGRKKYEHEFIDGERLKSKSKLYH